MIKSNKPAFIYDLRKYYPKIYNRYEKVKREMIVKQFEDNIIQGKREGVYREDINEQVLAKLNLMRIEGIMSTEYFSLEEYTSSDLFTEIFKYHLYGIVSDEGRKQIKNRFNHETNS